MHIDLRQGDCLEVLTSLPDNSIDSAVTDPPYGLEFMGKSWDGADGFRRSLNKNDVERQNVFGRASRTSPEYRAGSLFQEFTQAWATEVLRVLKPGGHLLAFGGARTYHRMAAGIEDAGFEIRDQIMWIYGQGFPKSRNLKGEWDGWGTALKPAHEPIVVARKPLSETVAANVVKYGTGAINIDGCRVPVDEVTDANQLRTMNRGKREHDANGQVWGMSKLSGDEPKVIRPDGRWPANVIHDGSEDVLEAFPDAPGQQGDLCGHSKDRISRGIFGDMKAARNAIARNDSGSAARFFYCAKASRKERGEGNNHPTVKPVALMRYLCRLVTPPGGTVLDPFTGSGSTGIAATTEGFNFLGIEREVAYVEIARTRLPEVRLT